MLVSILILMGSQWLSAPALAKDAPPKTVASHLPIPTKKVLRAYCDAHQVLKQGRPSKAELLATFDALVEERGLGGGETLLPILEAIPKDRWHAWLANTLHVYHLSEACYLVATDPPAGPLPSEATMSTLCHVMTPQPQTEDEETEGEGEGEEKKTADKKHAEGAFELLEQREKLTQDSFEQALTLVQVNSLSLAQRQTWMEWNVKRLAMTKECEGWSWPDTAAAKSEPLQSDEAP